MARTVCVQHDHEAFRRSLTDYISVPRSYVILQRINDALIRPLNRRPSTQV
jgi:hypothetical protein